MSRLFIALPLVLSSLAFAGTPESEASANGASDAKPEVTAPAEEEEADLPDFKELDTNEDARLSTTEVKDVAELEKSFATVDEDEDGALSRTEFKAWVALQMDEDAKTPAKPGAAPAK